MERRGSGVEAAEVPGRGRGRRTRRGGAGTGIRSSTSRWGAASGAIRWWRFRHPPAPPVPAETPHQNDPPGDHAPGWCVSPSPPRMLLDRHQVEPPRPLRAAIDPLHQRERRPRARARFCAAPHAAARASTAPAAATRRHFTSTATRSLAALDHEVELAPARRASARAARGSRASRGRAAPSFPRRVRARGVRRRYMHAGPSPGAGLRYVRGGANSEMLRHGA